MVNVRRCKTVHTTTSSTILAVYLIHRITGGNVKRIEIYGAGIICCTATSHLIIQAGSDIVVGGRKELTTLGVAVSKLLALQQLHHFIVLHRHHLHH